MKILFKLTSITVAGSLIASGCSSTARTGEQSGWKVLFDGTSTAAFRGFRQESFPTNSWVVDRGALKSIPQNQIDLITREKYEN